jgi:mannose-6-phosphate isomerase
VKAQPLTPTRVYRFYRGGALIGRLRGEPEEDGTYPEDWVGSATHASNPGREDPVAGLSRLRDGRLLRDAVAADPDAWLGRAHLARYGTSTGVLVKLLDAAERLPVHAHPSRAFASARLRSQFGKTEAWIVLATRADAAAVYVGLTESVSRERYAAWIETQDVDALLGSLNPLQVRAGDVLYVPAGIPHAIGAGVLIAEVQEPTDFSLVCEWRGYPIRADDAHLGLGWDEALGALDLGTHRPIRALPDAAREFFCVDAVAEPGGRFAVVLVLEGTGTIDAQPVRAGDAVAIPASARELDVRGELRVLRFAAPEP